jgi:hypothetical protein
MVRRYQCVAIGKAGGVITVAITDPAHAQMLRKLEELTGYSFFPVLVDAKRLKLLIRRLELAESRRNPLLILRPTPPTQVHSTLVLLLALHQHIASA